MGADATGQRNRQSPSMSFDSQPPLEAKVLPDPPAPRPLGGGNAWSWILAGSVFLSFVALFALLLWGIGRLVHGKRQLEPRRSGSLVQTWETPSQRLTSIKSALAAGDSGCSPAELRELERLFSRVAGGAHLPP